MSTRIQRTLVGALCAIGAALSLVIIFVVVMSGKLVMPRYARGTVIGYHRDLTAHAKEYLRYFPVVEFSDTSGATQSLHCWTGELQPSYATSEIVSVLYIPSDNPKMRRADIASASFHWASDIWLPWVLSVMSFVCVIPFVVAAYALLNGRRIRDVISRFGHAPKSAS